MDVLSVTYSLIKPYGEADMLGRYQMIRSEMMRLERRYIVHSDCNNFFASVELRNHPELRNIPFAVAGDPSQRHGIILAKNEIARSQGVLTAETIASARVKCPQLRCVPPHMEQYKSVSREIEAIYQRYTDLVERFSIDECFLDISEAAQNSAIEAMRISDLIRESVYRETGCSVSVGLSFTKTFAKIASSLKRPNALSRVDIDEVETKIYPLAIEKMLFVGAQTAERLRQINIETIGDLALADTKMLEHYLGKAGYQLSLAARGLDERSILPSGVRGDPKTIACGQTFGRDLLYQADVANAVSNLADELWNRLARARKKAYGIRVNLRNSNFEMRSRQLRLANLIENRSVIQKIALDLILGIQMGDELRFISLTAFDLEDEGQGEQMSFDNWRSEQERFKKHRRISDLVGDLQERFGREKIALASEFEDSSAAEEE